jgi:hypothetical protein
MREKLSDDIDCSNEVNSNDLLECVKREWNILSAQNLIQVSFLCPMDSRVSDVPLLDQGYRRSIPQLRHPP